MYIWNSFRKVTMRQVCSCLINESIIKRLFKKENLTFTKAVDIPIIIELA